MEWRRQPIAGPHGLPVARNASRRENARKKREALGRGGFFCQRAPVKLAAFCG
jgi:hypothetical protein